MTNHDSRQFDTEVDLMPTLVESIKDCWCPEVTATDVKHASHACRLLCQWSLMYQFVKLHAQKRIAWK